MPGAGQGGARRRRPQDLQALRKAGGGADSRGWVGKRLRPGTQFKPAGDTHDKLSAPLSVHSRVPIWAWKSRRIARLTVKNSSPVQRWGFFFGNRWHRVRRRSPAGINFGHSRAGGRPGKGARLDNTQLPDSPLRAWPAATFPPGQRREPSCALFLALLCARRTENRLETLRPAYQYGHCRCQDCACLRSGSACASPVHRHRAGHISVPRGPGHPG